MTRKSVSPGTPTLPAERLRGIVTRPGRWRDTILGDIEALLNDSMRSSRMPCEGLPYLAQSVLNHGLPPLASLSADQAAAWSWANHLHRILTTFEQRLLPTTLRVAPVVDAGDRQVLAVYFDVEGELLPPRRGTLAFRIALDRIQGNARVAT
jgi:type VI secretion system protein ImpF